MSKYIEVTDRFKSQRSKSDDRSYVNDQYKQLFHPKSEGSQTSELSPRVLRKMSSPSPGSFRRKIKDQQRWFVFIVIALIFICWRLQEKYHESIVPDTHHWTCWVRPSLHTSSLSTPTPGTLSTRWPALRPAGQSWSAPVASTPAPAVICLIYRSPLYVFQNDLNMIKPLIVFC